MQILTRSSFMLPRLESGEVVVTTSTIAETPCRELPIPLCSQARSSPCRFLGNNYASWVIITNRSSRIVYTYVYVAVRTNAHDCIDELRFYRKREHQVRTTKTDGLVNLLATRILSFSHSTFFFSNTVRPLKTHSPQDLSPNAETPMANAEVLQISAIVTRFSH